MNYTQQQALNDYLDAKHENDEKDYDWICCENCGGQICQENDDEDYSEYDDYNELKGKVYCLACYEEGINELQRN